MIRFGCGFAMLANLVYVVFRFVVVCVCGLGLMSYLFWVVMVWCLLLCCLITGLLFEGCWCAVNSVVHFNFSFIDIFCL